MEGESSGAHLAVVTLLRLRDRHGVALSGANLIFGFYDLTLTPSARLFGDDRVAPRTTDLRSYVKAFVPEGDLAAPEISPLYADLNNLCPALFTVGTQDPLLARSEEHTSELQSLMRISYAVFCLKKNNK